MDTAVKIKEENEDRVAEEYLSSLSDLNCNSKPLINMLTMLAEENIEYAPVIVKVVEQHIAKVPPDVKLPILYLIDSIIKNVKNTYVQLFSQCIVNIFCNVFEKVNEKTRERMYALRQTWVEVFSSQKLYSLDVRVKRLDQNWPITAKPPSIHVNPNFLKTVNVAQAIPSDVGKILQDKTRELLELKKIKLELELEATKKHLEQEKQLLKSTESIAPSVKTVVVPGALETAINSGLSSHTLPSQMIPGVMSSNYVTSKTLCNNAAVTPDIYSNRGFRPHLHSDIMNVHQGVSNSKMLVGGCSNTVDSSSKSQPVNMSLINSVRQRDPRLSRQLTQQQPHLLQINQEQEPEGSTHVIKSTTDLMKSTNSTKNERIIKSPNKISSQRSSTSNSNNSDPSGQSEKNFTRDKNKSRSKRSASRSSTTSLSSAGSNVSTELNKSTIPSFNKTDKNSTRPSTSTSCDKDAFEIAPLATAFKPSLSPNKLHSIKRNASQKSHNYTREKNESSTSSPQKDHFHDIDLRQASSTGASSPGLLSKHTTLEKEGEPHLNNEECLNVLVSAKNLDKKIKARKYVDMDLRSGLVAPSAPIPTSNVSSLSICKLHAINKISPTETKAATVTIDLTNSVTPNELSANYNATLLSSSPKFSFTIEKLVNKLGKSTGHFTVTDVQQHRDEDPKLLSAHVSKYMPGDDDIKKRPSDMMIKDRMDEPLAKKSKSVKLDELFGSPELFGSEDVDLRELMPVIRSASCKEEKIFLPQCMKEGKLLNHSDNWDDFKGETFKMHPSKTCLDDVRAKLAKTAKLNIFKADENSNKEFSHRIRLAELQNMNEDTQEANDERIRTMISQAQELLETKSITKEQHTNLLQTVMSINEANKLKIAKRQESLNAAREAVLKKRIPKLNKSQINGTNDQQVSSKSDASKRYEDKGDKAVVKESSRSKTQRDKRFPKVSKWSDRVIESSTNKSNMWSAKPLVRPWVRGLSTNRSMHPTTNHNIRMQCFQRLPLNGVSNECNYNQPRNVRCAAQPPHGSIVKNSCNSIDNPQKDLVRTIIIDGVAKEIRFYDKVAIVFMEVDQPHEISFQNGQRTICIDNHETILLKFNEDFKPITIDGEIFHMRFGFPSRELYIDEHWYEIYFGGPPVTIPIRNSIHMLEAEGPPPQVNIGALRRDLVVGKINMIVDAQNIVPLFLDARVQTFRLGNMEHTIQFADNLLTVLLNGIPMRVEYGGLPKSCFLKGKKYFVRFSALPKGIIAGKIQIKNMMYVETQPPIAQQHSPMGTNNSIDLTEIPEVSSKMENVLPIATTLSSTSISTTTLSNINIDELFQKLVSSGILNSSNNILSTVNKCTAIDGNLEEKKEFIKPIDLSKPESIRKRQSAIVDVLFSGMPCSMCGIRFPQTNKQTNKYSQHLNWHYRQKRREKDMSRKARSRKWYYELNDWAQYEEVEDEEEQPSKNFFESQKHELEIVDETSNQRSLQSPLPCCPAGTADEAICNMCHEKFEQAYNHDSEEWQLQGAIRVEDNIYHPLCYEDFKASLNSCKTMSDAEEQSKNGKYEDVLIDTPLIQIDEDNAVDISPNQDKEENHSKNEEEDDDVIVLPNEEPSVTEIVDDDEDEYVVKTSSPKTPEKNVISNDVKQSEENSDETLEQDVEIQEPCIPFTDLDTYNEKEPTNNEENTQVSVTGVKIKEEPKGDEDDEDDGFEDVGTVLISPDEISIQSENNSQSLITGIVNMYDSSASNILDDNGIVEQNSNTQDLNAHRCDNLEVGNEGILSSTCPTSKMPMVSLINKIKINISKNTVTMNNATATNSNNSTSAYASTCVTTATGQSHINILTSPNENINNNLINSFSNPIPTISTIPVLCSGGTSTPSIMSSSFERDSCLSGDNSDNLIQPTVVSPESEIQYESKPALKQVSLKKKEKIICGNETSGLCSIM